MATLLFFDQGHKYTLDGEEIGSVNLVSSENVERAGFGDALKKAATRLLNMRDGSES